MWKLADMPGVPKELIEHALKVDPKATPKKQRLRRFSPDKREAIKKELEKLLAAGYHHIALKEEDQIKTAFITPYGPYAYKTVSFGLKNAGATYQRAIQLCFSDQLHRNVEAYVDDVVVKTKT